MKKNAKNNCLKSKPQNLECGTNDLF